MTKILTKRMIRFTCLFGSPPLAPALLQPTIFLCGFGEPMWDNKAERVSLSNRKCNISGLQSIPTSLRWKTWSEWSIWNQQFLKCLEELWSKLFWEPCFRLFEFCCWKFSSDSPKIIITRCWVMMSRRFWVEKIVIH